MLKLPAWLLSIILIIPVMSAISCSTNPWDQTVIVAPDALVEGTVLTPGPNQQAAPVEVKKLPKAIRELVEKQYPDVPIVMVTTVEHVKPAEPAVPDNPATPDVDETKPAVPAPPMIPVTPPTDAEGNIDFVTWISQAIPALGTAVPQAAPFIPLLYLVGLLIKKRPRQHLADAAKALNPFDGGSVDVGEAISSSKKAIGYDHSLATPAELRAVADKLEADEKAKAALKAASGS